MFLSLRGTLAVFRRGTRVLLVNVNIHRLWYSKQGYCLGLMAHQVKTDYCPLCDQPYFPWKEYCTCSQPAANLRFAHSAVNKFTMIRRSWWLGPAVPILPGDTMPSFLSTARIPWLASWIWIEDCTKGYTGYEVDIGTWLLYTCCIGWWSSGILAIVQIFEFVLRCQCVQIDWFCTTLRICNNRQGFRWVVWPFGSEHYSSAWALRIFTRWPL